MSKHDLGFLTLQESCKRKKKLSASLSFREQASSDLSGLQFDFIADLSHNLTSCLNAVFLFSLTLRSNFVSYLSTAMCTLCWLFSLSSHVPPPGWKEPGDDHKCLAAAGMSPLQALFVWSLCYNCHLVYFWKVCVCVWCLCPVSSAIHIFKKGSHLIVVEGIESD